MNSFCDVYFYVKGQVSLYFGLKTAVLMLKLPTQIEITDSLISLGGWG